MVDQDQLFILELPEILADFFRENPEEFNASVQFSTNGRNACVVCNDKKYPADLMDLPTINEVIVSSNGETWYKTGDVSQVLCVTDLPFAEEHARAMTTTGESETAKKAREWHEESGRLLGTDFNPYEVRSGLTPPMSNARVFRFEGLPPLPQHYVELSDEEASDAQYDSKVINTQKRAPRASVPTPRKRSKKARAKAVRSPHTPTVKPEAVSPALTTKQEAPRTSHPPVAPNMLEPVSRVDRPPRVVASPPPAPLATTPAMPAPVLPIAAVAAAEELPPARTALHAKIEEKQKQIAEIEERISARSRRIRMKTKERERQREVAALSRRLAAVRAELAELEHSLPPRE
eukprot:gnl/Chilomastix_cuspidata/3582.p1 GENE.gnl/Chilomastix_cuspidata/3582~~gnl/Chilomastix_cuspidata/3582.p1  ORF type:complete len:348 (+),score=79.36 gnl/Chilomastix_cuspidata/3582:32-1075(+)